MCLLNAFRKATIPPPAPKITFNNLHLSTGTGDNRAMKFLGAPFLVGTY